MPSKASPKLKSLRRLRKTNDVLKRWERDLVLGRQVDISKLRAMLRSFLEDCQCKLQKDKRLGDNSRKRLEAYILHWRLLDEDLKKGKGSALYQVPRKIPTPAKAPLPDPSTPRAPSGYQSPTAIIRKKLGWPALLRPSKTRLFSLDDLPCFAPASLLGNAD